MAGGGSGGRPDVVARWFRALDQRRIRVGPDEWLLHVTGIYEDHDDVWIQIAEGCCDGASVLLRVSAHTSFEDALEALAHRGQTGVPVHPTIITARPTSARRQDSRTEIAALY